MPATQVPEGEAKAQLPVIAMEKIDSQDADAAEALVRAAQSPGFFYLELNGPVDKALMPDMETIFTVLRNYFTHPY